MWELKHPWNPVLRIRLRRKAFAWWFEARSRPIADLGPTQALLPVDDLAVRSAYGALVWDSSLMPPGSATLARGVWGGLDGAALRNGG